MAWYIDANVNEGYPCNTGFPSSYPANWTPPYGLAMWRIAAGQNEGYPFIGYWYEGSPSGGSDMEIGGSQTNYPNGFTSSNRGGVSDQFDTTSMHNPGSCVTQIRNAVYNAMAFRMWCLSGSELTEILSQFNSDSVFDSSARNLISEMYGSSVYDGIVICKVYPFPFPSDVVAPGQSDMRLFGRYLISAFQHYQAVRHYAELDLGSITIDIQQAWELESIDYSIYLPFAGVFPLDVRAGVEIDVSCTVDLYNGTGEYYVRQNGQVTGIYKTVLGIDIPLNFSQGITASNLVGNIASVVSQGLPLAAKAIGSPVASQVAGAAASAVDKTLVSHHTLTAPQVGGTASMLCYPYARVIAKIPKMFKDGTGYGELLGNSRQCSFVTLSSCSGYTVCRNYKTPIISATETEKREIERLMNEGVFV